MDSHIFLHFGQGEMMVDIQGSCQVWQMQLVPALGQNKYHMMPKHWQVAKQ
jgi:hypothetical protein